MVSQPQPEITTVGQPVHYRALVHYSPSLPFTHRRTPDIVDSLFLKINHEDKLLETELTES
jgi:hypothetical protein